MSAYDSTTTGEVLKDVFDDQMVKDTIYPNNPTFALMKKKKTAGTPFVFPIRYENPGGRSKTIATAIAGKKPGKFVQFSVPMCKDYNVTSFDRLFMAQTEKDEGSFLEDATSEVEKLLKRLTGSLARGMFRNTGGGCGTVGTPTATTIPLSDIEEVAGFSVGDVLVASANDGSVSTHTLRAGSFTISSIDRDTGVLTGTYAGGLDGTITAADTLFKDGDFQLGIAGFGSWCPSTAPTSTDSFYGANRYPDITRLSGCRMTRTGDPVSEAIQQACARLAREGATPDTVLMSHTKLRDLIIELGSKVQYQIVKPDDATVGFKAVEFVSPNGAVKCIADHNCPSTKMFVTKMSVWELRYASDGLPELQDDDGSLLFRELTSDGYEVRSSWYANMRPSDTHETCNVTHA